MLDETSNKNKVYIYLIILGAYGYVTKYILNIILSHHLTPRFYGDFNIAIQILKLSTSLSLLGTNSTAVRFLSHYLHYNKMPKIISFIEWNVKLLRVSFSICVFLGILSIAIMIYFHIWNLKNIQSYHLAIYMLWVTPLAATFLLLNSYLLSAECYLINALFQNTQSLLTMILFILIVFTLKMPIDHYSLGLILLLIYLIFIMIELIYFAYKMPIIGKIFYHALSFKNHALIFQDWFRVSSFLAINGLLSTVIFSCSLIIIQLIDPNKIDVCLYSVVLIITSCLYVTPQNIYPLLESKIADFPNTLEKRKSLEQDIKYLNRISYLITFILSGTMIGFSKEILAHFGDLYIPAERSLIILTIGFGIGTSYQPPCVRLVVTLN